MILKGKAHKFGDDVNTDEIIPASFLNISDSAELAKHCMAGIDPGFIAKISKGDIIVAGKNFGCGSSREHAPLSIKAAGISAVVAHSFARIFFRNAINIGLPIFESPHEIQTDSEIEIDVKNGTIKDLTSGKSYKTAPFPQFMEEIIKDGGLMKWVCKRHTK